MSRTYSVVEPHPTVPKSGAYLHVGRGGAGNVKKFKGDELSTGADATGPASASRALKSRPAPRLARTGRGGAGNYSSSANRTSTDDIFQFDEEMLNKRDSKPAPVYHVGRGGAGNLFYERPAAAERKDSTSSNSSTHSERLTALRRNSGGVLSIFSRKST